MTIIYMCDICGKYFSSKKTCLNHEQIHYKNLNPEDRVRLKYKNINEPPCSECKHAYYVYGMELDCEVKKKTGCASCNNYCSLEVKTNYGEL